MSGLALGVVDARPEPHAAVPTILLRIRVTETQGRTVHALVLRAQIRIEPQLRQYLPAEEDRLYELFGRTSRWGDSLRPFLWTHVSTAVGGFRGSTELDLPIACTYDFEVAGAKYLHSLEGGEIPLVLLFSGTVFTRAADGAGPTAGVVAEPVPWDLEASFRLPVEVWRATMDRYFPNSGWLRVERDTLDRLQRYKAAQAVPTWDQALELLFKQAGEEGS